MSVIRSFFISLSPVSTWVVSNALMHVFGIIFSVYTQSLEFYIAAIVAWHSILLGMDSKDLSRWYPNSITLFRLLHLPVLWLIRESSFMFCVVLTSFFICDALDGVVARLFSQPSEYGEYLDKDLDAASIGFLSLLVTVFHGIPYFFIIGMLRYGYVFFRVFQTNTYDENEYTDKINSNAKVYYVVSLVCLIGGFYFQTSQLSLILWHLSFGITIASFLKSVIFRLR